MKPKYWNRGKLYLSNKDKVLKKIILQFPKEHMTINTNHYHSLINSIIGQQISVNAASSIKNKFFSLDDNITPTKIIKINNRLIKKCGLSKQKTEYINNISIFFLKNKKFIKQIHSYDDEFIRINVIKYDLGDDPLNPMGWADFEGVYSYQLNTYTNSDSLILHNCPTYPLSPQSQVISLPFIQLLIRWGHIEELLQQLVMQSVK